MSSTIEIQQSEAPTITLGNPSSVKVGIRGRNHGGWNGQAYNCGCKKLKYPRNDGTSTNVQISNDNITPSMSVSSTDSENCHGVDQILRTCKTRILFPYFRVLGSMGLKPLKSVSGVSEESSSGFWVGHCLNGLYFSFLTIILGVGYVLQYLSCYRRDRGFVQLGLNYHSHGANVSGSSSTSTSPPNWLHHCGSSSNENSFYVHILPICLHFGAFLYMTYLYRIVDDDDEQLPHLLERVFLQIPHIQTHYFSHKKLVRNLQILMVIGISWICLSLGTRILEVCLDSGVPVVLSYCPMLRDELKHGLMSLLVLSTTWQDGLQVTLVTSYVVHCYLLSTQLFLLRTRLLQSPCLTETMKDLAQCQRVLNYLNGKLGIALGLLIIYDIGFLSSGLIFAFGKHERPLSFSQGLILWLNITQWIGLLGLPILWGTIVSSWTKSLREIGQTLRVRPFGYERVPEAELDSFLLFVSSLDFGLRVWGVEISGNWISGSLVIGWIFLFIWGLTATG